MSSPTKVPRKLWIMWLQGLDEAPFVVKKCIESWKLHNDTWDIVILTEQNLNQVVQLAISPDRLAQLSRTKRSNLIRMNLLSEHGGVWADATTYCMKPLDDWIDEASTSGFFAFSNPSETRILGNWFLASHPGNYLVGRMNREQTSFFGDNQFRNDSLPGRAILFVLRKLFNRNIKSTTYWLSPIVIRFFRVYPYFIFHYIFAKVVADDVECDRIWERTPKMSADGPHLIHHMGHLSRLDVKKMERLVNDDAPLYKLSWKFREERYKPETPLHFLLEGRFNPS